MQQVRNFIDRAHVDGSEGKTFEKRSPLDDTGIAHVAEASRADVDRAVQAARRALEGPWKTRTLAERVALLERVADEMTRRFEDFVATEIAGIGMLSMTTEHMCARGAANFRIFADVVKNVPTECFEMATRSSTRSAAARCRAATASPASRRG